jgi:lipopolysaccharide biosynthesis regulator YciM
MGDYAFVAVLLALLLGLVAGKAWERYKLRDGRWIDRRRLRETPHYMLGLNYLVDSQVDQAVEELTRAASGGTDALEIQMILGNLYRQKGQVGKAIALHQALLQRPDLRTLEHAYVLLCLGLDFRTGGFIDRAIETFQEVVRLDPPNRYALVNLQKLYEDQRQWSEAAAARERIAAIDGGDGQQNRQILGFLRNEVGLAVMLGGDDASADRIFQTAIDIDRATAPAYLNLGDARERQGDHVGAVEAWEKLVREVPERAHLAFARLERSYRNAGTPGKFVELCERLVAASPGDWRARLAHARHLAAAGRYRDGFELLLEALVRNPHALALHQDAWRTLLMLDLEPSLVERYVDLTRRAVFYLDPHVCVHCRYRSTELLWQCPQCREWNTFVEERLAPAKDPAQAELAER